MQFDLYCPFQAVKSISQPIWRSTGRRCMPGMVCRSSMPSRRAIARMIRGQLLLWAIDGVGRPSQLSAALWRRHTLPTAHGPERLLRRICPATTARDLQGRYGYLHDDGPASPTCSLRRPDGAGHAVPHANACCCRSGRGAGNVYACARLRCNSWSVDGILSSASPAASRAFSERPPVGTTTVGCILPGRFRGHPSAAQSRGRARKPVSRAVVSPAPAVAGTPACRPGSGGTLLSMV